MSNKSFIEREEDILDKLVRFQNGESVSRYLLNKLRDVGYIDMLESRKPGQRGNTTKSFRVSEKGRSLMERSKSWAKN